MADTKSIEIKIKAENLECIKNAVKTINNKVYSQNGELTQYDKDLLDALLGEEWEEKYSIGNGIVE